MFKKYVPIIVSFVLGVVTTVLIMNVLMPNEDVYLIEGFPAEEPFVDIIPDEAAAIEMAEIIVDIYYSRLEGGKYLAYIKAAPEVHVDFIEDQNVWEVSYSMSEEYIGAGAFLPLIHLRKDTGEVMYLSLQHD